MALEKNKNCYLSKELKGAKNKKRGNVEYILEDSWFNLIQKYANTSFFIT